MNSGSSMIAKLSCLASLCLVLGLTGCIGLFQPEMPDESYRRACGQQCLKNGEDCSRFFALKNEERRLAFEQAKTNYWMCMRRFGDQKTPSSVPCLAPGPQPEAYDHCGNDLEQCLSKCPVTLEELPSLHGIGPQGRAVNPPAPSSSIPSGTPAAPDGLPVFK
jgi:hypothetical protein